MPRENLTIDSQKFFLFFFSYAAPQGGDQVGQFIPILIAQINISQKIDIWISYDVIMGNWNEKNAIFRKFFDLVTQTVILWVTIDRFCLYLFFCDI